MRFKPRIKLNIHYGGTVVKTDETYRYVGEVGCKENSWKPFEIGWENFEGFLAKQKLMSSIALVWYKLPSEEMKDLKYVFDTTNDDMVEIQTAGQECGEVDVFLEQDREKDAEHDDGYEADNGEECLDRPREDFPCPLMISLASSKA
ncbi:hypothetical protein Bca4012_082872 [Brassica carinata]